MSIKPLSVHVVPAQAGFSVVYASDDKKLFTGPAVVAWQVEIWPLGQDRTRTAVKAITVDGDDEALWGILEPSGQVVRPDDSYFDDLKSAEASLEQPK